MSLTHFLIINLGALMTAAGGVFLKRLSDQLDHDLSLVVLALQALKSPNLWLGGFCFVFPVFLWTYLLKYMELTKLQPQLTIVYLYTIALSMIFLGEVPSLTRILGVVLIILGVIVVSRT